ncbi:probable splicing factor YJU2B [Erinaceus europaeus]|uniref:Probable splicing factor YJU2B n=1 Tax=Erinaceus europaeus TaxID=9365 RepID=A0A1S3WNP5_ERIEU|nr:probable splicing factor YJU2B [Erinaceus europaeus]XP_060037822.1 probable splicing factor YJU2B [Erinaceus europaeus]
MGERKGVSKYYPPDFNPEKHGSLNRYHHSHPLRERARKLAQGILVIRFEMPYNIWCDGCKNHIGMGVRYNAEKKKVGSYYSTPIYRFRMKCHLCVNYIEMQTDPASCDYVIVSGARRKEERWDPEDNAQVQATEHETKQKLETDAMFRLEHGEADRHSLHQALPSLSRLQEAQGAWKDDFALNSLLRKRFREKKKAMQEQEERTQALQAKASLDIPLLPEAEEDRRLAALLTLHAPDSYEDRQRLKRTEISTRPWFPTASGTPSTPGCAPRRLAPPRRPPATPISPGDLGIVRRRSPQPPTPAEGVPQPQGQSEGDSRECCLPENPQTSRPEEAEDMGGSPDSPGSPQDSGHPSCLSLGSSLVADYSDSESD